MGRHGTGLAALVVLALGCAAASAEDPDPGFLEFLGSVDRLAEVNPDYLSQADPARPGKPAAKAAEPPPRPAPPPPPPPQALPPSASNATGAQKNE